MFSRITNIWGKELIDSLRDRKALRQAILIPLVVGVFYALFNPWLASVMAEKAQQPVTVPTQGLQYASPELLAALKTQQITLEPYEGDLRAIIAKGEKGSGLIIPPEFATNIAAERPASVTLLLNPTSGGLFGGDFASERLELAINAYSRAISIERLEGRNLDPAILSPVSVESQNLARPEQMAGIFASLMLPILLATIVAQGGLFVAIDTTAGEKERGTLESLLATPASDLEVLSGKLGAVFTITCIPIALTFAGFWVGSQIAPTTISQGGRLPAEVILGAILLSLPLALFVDVVLMIVSVRTKSFKDAQQAATPIGFGAIVPAMAAAFIVPTHILMYAIPVYGPSAVLSQLAIGAQIPPMAFVLAIVGSLLAAAICFVIALRFFNRERLLYSA